MKLFFLTITLVYSATTFADSCHSAKSEVIKCFTLNIVLNGEDMKSNCEDPLKNFIKLYNLESCGKYPYIDVVDPKSSEPIPLDVVVANLKRIAIVIVEQKQKKLKAEEEAYEAIDGQFEDLEL